MPLEIEFADARWRRLRGLKPAIGKAHAAALSRRDAAKVTSLLLTTDTEIKGLNRAWRGKNKPTNVLSFPAGPVPRPRGTPAPLGDVALAYETCAREAKAQGKSLRDHALHLIVHGLLHLTGHDHMDESEARRMERKETRILQGLGIADPYE
jgi:probable rRNA maturation factor